MSDPPRLAVVGSTSFVAPGALDRACDLIVAKIRELEPEWIVSGGAKGIDTLGAAIGRAMGVAVIEHYPKHARWEPDGYKARNLLIVRDCTHLLRIACHASTTYGSGFTADEAERQGRTVWRVTL